MAPTGRLQVPQPAPFLQHPGDPPIPFPTWVAAFDSWIRLVQLKRGENLDDATKNSLLFKLVGFEGLRQFGSDTLVPLMTEAATTHTHFQDPVKAHFHHPVTVACAVLDFQERSQGTRESAADFVAALRELAPDCAFPATYLDRALAHSGAQRQSGFSSKRIKPMPNSVSDIPLVNAPFQTTVELRDSNGVCTC